MKKNTENPVESRVVAIQFDVEMPKDVDAQTFIDSVNAWISGQPKFNVVGSDVMDDLTDVYKKEYPELLTLGKPKAETKQQYALVCVINREVDALIVYDNKEKARDEMIRQLAAAQQVPVGEIMENVDYVTGITDRMAYTETKESYEYDWKIFEMEFNPKRSCALVEIVERDIRSLDIFDIQDQAYDEMCCRLANVLDVTPQDVKNDDFEGDADIEKTKAWAEHEGQNYDWKIVSNEELRKFRWIYVTGYDYMYGEKKAD